MYKIMLVEDDDKLKSQIQDILINYDYEVYAVTDFHSVLEDVDRVIPDLVVLDINLPYFDGNYYCRAIRKKYQMPIIITSARNEDSDQILSMELGSDDYIIKPFNIQVLLSRISACLRRAYGEYHQAGTDLSIKGLTLQEDSMKLSYQGNESELTKNEYKLLRMFMEAPGKVIRREELLAAIWDDKVFVDDNTLTVNVTRIKKKLDELGVSECIKTKRGMGYVFLI